MLNLLKINYVFDYISEMYERFSLQYSSYNNHANMQHPDLGYRGAQLPYQS